MKKQNTRVYVSNPFVIVGCYDGSVDVRVE
jgi:hypothetical protein